MPLPAFEEPSSVLAAVPVERGCAVCPNLAGKFPMKRSVGGVLVSLVPLEFGSERHGREPTACCRARAKPQLGAAGTDTQEWGDGRAASSTSWEAAGHSMGTDEACPRADVNGLIVPLQWPWHRLAFPRQLGVRSLSAREQKHGWKASALLPISARCPYCSAGTARGMRRACRHPHLNAHVLGWTSALPLLVSSQDRGTHSPWAQPETGTRFSARWV